jgi:type IV secretory pathway ATPase VirB11/archaellum biosynthesis ATPase
MPEQKRGECFSYEVFREGDDTILRVDCESCSFFPSLEDSPLCMARTCDKLVENAGITRITFYQKRDYEYDYEQTMLLMEVAKLHNQLLKQKNVFSYENLGSRYAEIRNIVFNLLKSDPIAAYVELRRISRQEQIELNKADQRVKAAIQKRLSVINYLVGLLEKTRLVELAKPRLAGYKVGDRSIYREIFRPTIKPDFMFTRLMASYPQKGEEIASYSVGNTEVTVFKLPETVQYLYHVTPPEFKLSEDKYEILDAARKIVAEHKPSKQEFVDPERMRQVFFNVGHDLIEELAANRNLRLRNKEVEELTNILVRYTVGFGLIEVLLQDEKVQDVTINSPMGRIPMFIVHQDFSDCMTNIIPMVTEGESWASKLRMISGRPLDEANPILDTELLIPGARARVAVIAPPLNPTGLAYAFRRHRDKPWTLPLFIRNRMINSITAGILSFLIDGARTMLIAGTRSAGKTSLLGSLMTEIMRKYRQITIEDTLELPVSALRKLNYNIQSMKVASAMTRGTTEVAADEGIRTTLRMGDSCLIVGEVRSTEARALYEAMRIGAMANVVAGTIHGDSPYGVFDRVVNDLNVPKTSFKATDIIVVANPIRSPDGLHSWRRVTQVTEVGKFWKDDPLLERGFRDLLKYNSLKDELEPTADLVNGESDVLKAVAANVKEWSGSWDAVWGNVMLRAKTKEALVNTAAKQNMPGLLEADFVVRANDEFHKVLDRVKEEVGLDNKRVFFEWNEWLKRAVKKMKTK